MNFQELSRQESQFQELVNEITDIAEMGRIIVISGGTDFACASLTPDSQPVIRYNPEFIRKITSIHVSIAETVLAHEVGHHFYDHLNPATRECYSAHQQEIMADFFAGSIMRLKGAPLRTVQILFDLPGFEETESHPDRKIRKDAAASGWKEMDKVISPEKYIPVSGSDKIALTIGVILMLIIVIAAIFYFSFHKK